MCAHFLNIYSINAVRGYIQTAVKLQMHISGQEYRQKNVCSVFKHSYSVYL
jgi:hypothetical protein